MKKRKSAPIEFIGGVLGDYFLDDTTPEEKKRMVAFRKRLHSAMKNLKNFSTKDQEILRMRFGMDGKGGHTLKEVGLQFDVTQAYIRKLESEILSI